MKKYLGVKLINAEPWLGIDDKCIDKNKVYPESIDPSLGYKVIYEDGYESWIPKRVFEKAYKEVTSGDKVLIEFDLKTGNWELIKYL